jgi:hypothetical protein
MVFKQIDSCKQRGGHQVNLYTQTAVRIPEDKSNSSQASVDYNLA